MWLQFYFLSFLGGVVGLGVTVMAGTMYTMSMYPMYPPGTGPAPGPPPPPPPGEPEPEPEPEDGERSMLIFFGVLAIPVSILTCILLGFLAFHTYLSCSGQTTKAVVRAAREKKAAKRLAAAQAGGDGSGEGEWVSESYGVRTAPAASGLPPVRSQAMLPFACACLL